MLEKQNAQLHTVTVFEKKRINELMRTVLSRLRKRKIGVTDIVAMLAHRGIPLSRANFDDLMTTRPERDSTLPLSAFRVFVDVIYAYDATILSAEELLDFVNVMRVPVSELAYYRNFVAQQAWAGALTSYGLSAMHWSAPVIGREEEVSLLLRHLNAGTSVVLTGSTGVGKTAVATEVIRRSSIEFGTKTHYIDGRAIPSISALNDLLCVTFQLLMQDNLVSAIRIKQYLQNNIMRVVIDDFHDTQNLTLRTFVRYLVKELPQLVVLITTSKKYLKADYAPMTLLQLGVLPYESDDSNAAILIRRTVVESGAPQLSLTAIRKIRALTHGSPLGIRIATIHYLKTQQHELTFLLNEISTATLDHMSLPARSLFDVLAFLDMHIPVHVLKAFSKKLLGQTAKELDASLHELHAAGFVLIVQGIGDVVLLQNTVRDAIGGFQSPGRTAILIQRFAEAMCEADGPHQSLTAAQAEHLDLQLDVPTILAIIQIILNNGYAEVAAAVLLRWSIYCTRHGHLAKATVTVEHCIELLAVNHVMMCGLQRFLGELYGIRGLVPQSTVHFNAAMNAAIRLQDATAIAEIRVVQTGATFNLIQKGGDPLYRLALLQLDEDVAHFVSINARVWVGRALMQRAEVYTYGGEQTEALKEINESIAVFQTVELSEWHADALRMRGTISLAIGDYVAARQDMQRALAYYEESNQIIERLKCHLRLAMLLFVLDDAPSALAQLERGMQLMTFVGGYRYVFSAFDIYAGILRKYGDMLSATTLRERTDALRTELQTYRSAVLDQIIESYFARVPPYAPQFAGTDVFLDAHTIQQVTATVLQSIRHMRNLHEA